MANNVRFVTSISHQIAALPQLVNLECIHGVAVLMWISKHALSLSPRNSINGES